MNLRKIVDMQGGLDDLQFEIKPKSLVFEGTSANYFALYLEKGVQVIGAFHSGNKHNPKESFFRFKNVEAGKFRLKSLSHATYTWNFYKVDPKDQSEQFWDSASFDIKRSIELYQSELREKERQIQTTFKEKHINKTVIFETWKRVKREMRTNKSVLKCMFHKDSIHLEFQLNINNSLDLAIAAEEQDGYRMRRSRSQPGKLEIQTATANYPKSRITDPFTIKDEHITKILNEVKGNSLDRAASSTGLTHKQNNQGSQSSARDDNERQAVVTVVNPNGIVLNIDADDYDLNRSDQNHVRVVPAKKFSLLSDIIERSHEGSSSYGGPDKISSTDKYPDKKDQIIYREQAEESKNIVSIDSPLLNKFKTLPHDRYKPSFGSNNLKVDLRRAQTAEKMHNNLDQSQYFVTENDKSELKDTPSSKSVEKSKQTSGDPYAKYIILVAFLIIAGIFGHQLVFGCKGKECRRNVPKKASKK